jgi:hypothetical protein
VWIAIVFDKLALEPGGGRGDAGLTFTEVDYLLDPLRNEPCFKVVLAELKFPE